jgi:ribosome maturation factor RimP
MARGANRRYSGAAGGAHVAGARAAASRSGAANVRPGLALGELRTRLRAVVAPLVAAAGLDLEDLTVIRAGRRFVVRAIIDGDAGVGHDELGVVSRDISAALDEAEQSGDELVPGSYSLEVSSPGVDRPLTRPAHWRRNVGRLVTVRAGDRTFTDRVEAADEAGVRFAGGVAYGYAELGPGRVQVEFGPAELDDLDDIDGDDIEEEDGA